jgi:hypothetical protein
MKQGGQTRLNTLKFGAILAPHQPKGLIPPHEPMVETTHNVRRAAPIGVDAARSEWGDELSEANLFVSHDL